MSRATQFRNVAVRSLIQAAIKGVEANMDPAATLSVNGTHYSKPDLIARLDALEKPYDDVDAAHVELARVVAIRDGGALNALSFTENFAGAIQALYGTDPTVLAKYGVPPKATRRQLTGPQIVAMAAKAKKTRAMRNTMGSREKEKVKATGEVTVSTTLSSDVPAPAPAPVANGATNGVAAPAVMNGAGH